MESVNTNFGLAETFFVLAGLILLSAPFALIYRPPIQSNFNSNTLTKSTAKKITSDPNEGKSKGFLRALLESYFFMLQDPAILLTFFYNLFINVTIMATLAFSTDMALSLGFSTKDTSHLLSTMGVSSLMGRILFGKVIDSVPKKSILLTVFALTTQSFAVCASTYLTSYPGQIVFAVLFGLTSGAYVRYCTNILPPSRNTFLYVDKGPQYKIFCNATCTYTQFLKWL